MKLKDIIEKRLDELGIGPVQAATGVGLGKDFIRDILTGRKKDVKQSAFPKIAEALDLDLSGLIKGELIPLSIEEKTDTDRLYNELSHTLTDREKKLIIDLIRAQRASSKD